MLVIGVVLFPATFIYAPIYLSIYAETSVKDPDNAEITHAIVLIFVWLLHLYSGRYCNKSASFLHNLQDFLEALGNINLCIKSPPIITWNIECYHWETRVHTDSEGRKTTTQEKVVTHRATGHHRIQGWKDESAPISSLFYLRSMILTRLLTKKEIQWTNEAHSRYTVEKQQWINRNNVDVHYDFSEERTIPHQAEHTLVYNSIDGELPWYTNANLLVQLDAVYLGWIPRMNLT